MASLGGRRRQTANGNVEVTLTKGLLDAHNQIKQLSELGISLEKITQDLENAGIKSFVEAFDRLLESIDGKRQALS